MSTSVCFMAAPARTRHGFPQTSAIRDRVAHLRPEDKKAGPAGLELADLVVSPIGRFVAGKPPQEDWMIVESKLRQRKADYLGAGLVILPKE